MNGIAEVMIKGTSYALKFGMQAVAALEDRTTKGGLLITSTEGYSKFLSDLLYCGMYGNSIRKDIAIVPYEEVMDLFEELSMQPDAAEQYANMTKAYFASIEDLRAKKEAIAETDKKKVK